MSRDALDVKGTVNQAIEFARSYPCCMCKYENSISHECEAGIKYRNTCKVYLNLKCEALRMKVIADA